MDLRGEAKNTWIFFVHVFKKEVEKRYPVSRKFEETYVAGSSLGALMSATLDIAAPHCFHKIGVFSLASWISEEPFLKLIAQKTQDLQNTYYHIRVGSQEISNKEEGVNVPLSQKYIDNTLNYTKTLLKAKISPDQIDLHVDVAMRHSETYWAKVFPEFLLFLQENQGK